MNTHQRYQPMPTSTDVTRREFVRLGAATAAASGIVLGVPSISGAQDRTPPPAPETNINDFMKVPKGKHALPGAFPGRVVEVTDPRSLVDDTIDAKVVGEMFERGVRALTGKDMRESFGLFFEPGDVVGLKVNPVGPPLINTHVELTQAVVKWLLDNKVPPDHIVIWDRFDYMLKDAGYTPDQFPKGVRIEGLQTMDETGNAWKDASGAHVSVNNFDKDVYYFAKGIVGKGVKGYKDDEFYLNQHVFNGEYLVLREADYQAVDEDRQPRGVQEHWRRHLHGDQESRVRLPLQHRAPARAALLQRLHGGPRRAPHPGEARAERHRGAAGPV